MQNVMKKAWEIAKKGAEKFGGRAIEYIAEALRMAWRIVKNGMENKKEVLFAKIDEFVELSKETNKYDPQVNVVNGDELKAAYKEEIVDQLIERINIMIEKGKAYLEHLKETVVRTNKFEKVYSLSKLTKTHKSGKEVKADGEGYFLLNQSRFYEVVEDGEVKYIQVSPKSNKYRELTKDQVINWI